MKPELNKFFLDILVSINSIEEYLEEINDFSIFKKIKLINF
jgi:hypothetical protein